MDSYKRVMNIILGEYAEPSPENDIIDKKYGTSITFLSRDLTNLHPAESSETQLQLVKVFY